MNVFAFWHDAIFVNKGLDSRNERWRSIVIRKQLCITEPSMPFLLLSRTNYWINNRLIGCALRSCDVNVMTVILHFIIYWGDRTFPSSKRKYPIISGIYFRYFSCSSENLMTANFKAAIYKETSEMICCKSTSALSQCICFMSLL